MGAARDTNSPEACQESSPTSLRSVVLQTTQKIAQATTTQGKHRTDEQKGDRVSLRPQHPRFLAEATVHDIPHLTHTMVPVV